MNTNNLRKAIVRSGLRQKQLAEMLGVSPNTLSRWLSGEFQPNDKKKRELAERLNTSVSYLIGETDDPDLTIETAVSSLLHGQSQPDELISLLAQVRKQMISEYPGMDVNDKNIVKNLLAKINTLVDDTAEGNEEIA